MDVWVEMRMEDTRKSEEKLEKRVVEGVTLHALHC